MISVEEAIEKRRSRRKFASDRDFVLEQISQLIWSAQGVTARQAGYGLRAAPSAGAFYPMELYLLSKDGVFHYLPDSHELETKGTTDLRKELAAAALYQDFVAQAAIDIIICAVYQRMTGKYGKRGIRYVDMEAGHIAQNIHLQAVAMGLSSVPVGAFDDAKIKRLLSLPDTYEPIYIIPVGYAG
jgi:SagB-type dehydrogenase family enzyme